MFQASIIHKGMLLAGALYLSLLPEPALAGSNLKVAAGVKARDSSPERRQTTGMDCSNDPCTPYFTKLTACGATQDRIEDRYPCLCENSFYNAMIGCVVCSPEKFGEVNGGPFAQIISKSVSCAELNLPVSEDRSQIPGYVPQP